MSKIRIALFAGAIGMLALAACGGSNSNTGGTSGGARTVEVTALDTLRFEPASISVKPGEKIRFVVTNTGKTVHEFVLGGEDVQMAHEQQSGQMDHSMAGALAMLRLEAGQTKEATITFEEAGKILFGCHEPGHYQGGMVGTITVS